MLSWPELFAAMYHLHRGLTSALLLIFCPVYSPSIKVAPLVNTHNIKCALVPSYTVFKFGNQITKTSKTNLNLVPLWQPTVLTLMVMLGHLMDANDITYKMEMVL